MEQQTSIEQQLPPLVERWVQEVQKTNPNVKVVPKRTSKLMLAIGWFFRVTNISPDFIDGYYTTIGSTVYVPSQAFSSDPVRVLEVLMHECLHASDSKKWPVLFPVSYLAPQVFAALALLALLAPLTSLWMLLWLLCLLFLLPIPSPGRYHWELRAFRTSILYSRKVYGCDDEQMKDVYGWVIGQLATKYYYFAWPFPSRIESDLKDESFMSQPEYQKMLEFLSKEGLLLDKPSA